MTDKWQGGHTYVPGSLVIPASSNPVISTAIANAGFETGDLTSWDQSAGVWIVTSSAPYAGTYSAQLSVGAGSLDMDAYVPVAAGQSITATVLVQLINSGTNNGDGAIALLWFDSAHGALGAAVGGHVTGSGGSYKPSTVHGIAPADGFVKIRFAATAPTGGHIQFDNASWDYAFANPNAGIVYKATQAAPGKSGTSEPVWPGVIGVSVTDNEVTWEGELATRIVWQASPLARSGDTEPAWPALNGASVHDGTIDWIAQTPQITDPNCPHSKIVVIAASKVYAADNDIIRYSATVNPLDWSSPNNAGFLPYGLQTYGGNPCAAMGLYRSDVVAFSAEGFQNWQVDEDPANTTLLDALPIASTWNAALSPTANDLFFLSSKGVRSVGISATGVSLETGGVGMPIDILVQAFIATAIANGFNPISCYVPAEAQYWISFGDTYVDGVPTTATVFVYTINVPLAPGKWSRYVFPFPIDDFTQLNDFLYIRSGDGVLRVDKSILIDCAGADGTGGFSEKPFDGVVQWPWLDGGSPGITKQLIGFDIVGTGIPTIDIGYDQTNFAAFTTPFDVPADSVPGMLIPVPMTSPSFSFRATYKGGTAGQKWQLQAVNLWFNGLRPTS